jgi:hypothetical protein
VRIERGIGLVDEARNVFVDEAVDARNVFVDECAERLRAARDNGKSLLTNPKRGIPREALAP